MFLEKYLTKFYYNQVLDNYDEIFLDSLDEYNFLLIYQLFKSYNFYYIEDIILKCLEIFTMDYKLVNKKILKLKDTLGDNFVYIIGNDMKYLNELLNLKS